MDQSFVYFRAAGTEDFYYVLMKPRAPEDFVGELPRPMPGIRGIDYFVQALDRAEPAEEDSGVRPSRHGQHRLPRRADRDAPSSPLPPREKG